MVASHREQGLAFTTSPSLTVRIGRAIGLNKDYHFLTSASRYTRGQYEHEDSLADAGADNPDYETTRLSLDLPLHKPSCIDNEYGSYNKSQGTV